MSPRRELLLAQVCSLVSDKVPAANADPSSYVSTDSMIQNRGGLLYSSNPPCTGSVSNYKSGDILLSNIRPYFKKLHYCSAGGTCSGDVLVIRANNVDSEYLYYQLSTEAFFCHVMSGAKGTKMPRGDKSQIMMFPITVPSRLAQQRIVSILKPLDAKIENNNRMCQVLEEMAQALFKSWFVDFEPFQDGEFVDSELGPIPEGFGVTSLGEMLSELQAGNRPKGGVGFLGEGVPSIGAENIIGLGRYDYAREKYVSKEYFESMRKGVVKPWDVLLYKDGAQLGRKTIFGKGFPHSVCCVNSHVFILRTNTKVSQAYLYFWLDQPSVTADIINLNSNSAQPGINQQALKSLRVLMPQKSDIDSFDHLANPILEKIFILALEAKKLGELRDTLLPKLMSGEIEIPE